MIDVHALRNTLLAVTVAALAIAGCGGSATGPGTAGTARALLRETFGGHHQLNSGRLQFALSVQVSGSSRLTKPLSLSFSGPFQEHGKGKLPSSDFTVALSGEGRSLSLALISTGTAGYIAVAGSAYTLPSATFQQLESGVAQAASPGGSGGSSSPLARFGIQPLRWLADPQVRGTGTVGGAPATEITAGVNVPQVLSDLSTILQKGATLGLSRLPSSITPAAQQRIAAAVHSPRVEIWTGTADHTLRRLALFFEIPLSGTLATLTGGGHAAKVSLTLGYSDVNQPQTVQAPVVTQPYSQFVAKFRALVTAVETQVAAGALGSATGAGSPGSAGAGAAGTATGSTTTSAGTTGAGVYGRYEQCQQQAGGDLAKLQKCASLLPGG
jgi:hypothetical protein